MCILVILSVEVAFYSSKSKVKRLVRTAVESWFVPMRVVDRSGRGATDRRFRVDEPLDRAYQRSNCMCHDNDQTPPPPPEFDFSAFPEDTLFHERREGRERRTPVTKNPRPSPEKAKPTGERRARAERRRRIDPTTFEKQYSNDEMEFMNAIQRLQRAERQGVPILPRSDQGGRALGYRQVVDNPWPGEEDEGALAPA